MVSRDSKILLCGCPEEPVVSPDFDVFTVSFVATADIGGDANEARMGPAWAVIVRSLAEDFRQQQRLGSATTVHAREVDQAVQIAHIWRAQAAT
jgi:hypothetical protein